jgi:hypothetical protein
VKKDIPSGWTKDVTLVHVSIASIVYMILIGYIMTHGTKTVDVWTYVGVFIGSAFVAYWIPTGLIREYYSHGAIYRHYTITKPSNRTNKEVVDYIVEHMSYRFEHVTRSETSWLERFFLITGTHMVFDGNKKKRFEIHVGELFDEKAQVVIFATPAVFDLVTRMETMLAYILASSNIDDP